MKITVARTFDEIECVAASWDRLPIASPHASRPLFTLVQRAAGDRGRPHTILIEDDDRQPILVVGRIERRPMQIKAGYRTLFSARARWLVVVAGGVVGAHTNDDYDLVIRSLRASLRRGEADLVQLSKVEVDSPLHRAAQEGLAWYRRGHGATAQVHHRSDLSGGFEAFLAARSKGTRWRLRKRLRKLDEAGVKIAVRQIGADDQVDDAVRALDGIAAKSYQRGIGVGFVDDDLHRGLLSWGLSGGAYRVWLLSIDGTPAAYLNGVLHERIFHLFETAFDATFTEDEPGAILLARVLEELAADPDVDGFDYGYGDAQYKQSLSDAHWDDIDVLGFAARSRALALNSLNIAATTAVAMAKRLLGAERVAALRRRRRVEMAHANTTGADGE